MSDVASSQRVNRAAPSSEVLPPRQVLSLVLRSEEHAADANRRVTWDAGVREPTFQRVSKCCCVFHKKRMFGESDSDSSSSDDDDGCVDESHHHHHDGSEACTHHDAAQSSCCGESGAPESERTTLVIKRSKKPRPKCTKANCYCGTRFS